MDRPTWQRSLAVALDDLAALVAPKRIIICEGGSAPRFNDDGLDGQIYNRIFAESEPDTQFFSTGSHADTERTRAILSVLTQTVLPGLEVRRLFDRDDRSDIDIETERRSGNLVLSRRNLESYLFGDEVIKLLCSKEGKPEIAEQIIRLRGESVIARSAPVDDFKAAAGETYVACKKMLSLVQAGNTTKSFMRDTLAPLVTSGTATFAQLHQDVFAKTRGAGA